MGDIMFNNLYMNLAVEEAKKAFLENEVPVGAVIIRENEVISKNHNIKTQNNDIMGHAEIVSLLDASKKIGDWRLNDCEMYITLEPCPMCAGAILNSRIKKIYIGTKSNILSNSAIIKGILQNKEYNHYVEIEYVNDAESSKILSAFFSNKR